MKNYFFLLITIFSLRFLSGEEKIGGTLENVDLMITDLINEDNHNYGERYYAINHNPYSMRISIKLTDGFNAENRLIRHTIIVEPHDRVELGLITQKDLSKNAEWKYEWQTRVDI
jgi:hypothetical protein